MQGTFNYFKHETESKIKNSDKCDGCEGSPPLESEECNTQPCTCWGDWQPWSECPDQCGKDVRTRVRDNICDDDSLPEGEGNKYKVDTIVTPF